MSLEFVLAAVFCIACGLLWWTIKEDGPWLAVPLIWFAVTIGILSVHTDMTEGHECEKAGGQWVSRSSACVTPFNYKDKK